MIRAGEGRLARRRRKRNAATSESTARIVATSGAKMSRTMLLRWPPVRLRSWEVGCVARGLEPWASVCDADRDRAASGTRARSRAVTSAIGRRGPPAAARRACADMPAASGRRPPTGVRAPCVSAPASASGAGEWPARTPASVAERRASAAVASGATASVGTTGAAAGDVVDDSAGVVASLAGDVPASGVATAGAARPATAA